MNQRLDTIRLGSWQEGAVYAATALLFLTGIVWLGAHYFLATPGDYGPTIHPAEPWMLRFHGAAAMLDLVVYGSLLPIHVRRAWSLRRNIPLGIGVLSLMAGLTITGYLLYYAGDEDTRPIYSAVHWIIGLVVPLALLLHVVTGRRRVPV